MWTEVRVPTGTDPSGRGVNAPGFRTRALSPEHLFRTTGSGWLREGLLVFYHPFQLGVLTREDQALLFSAYLAVHSFPNTRRIEASFQIALDKDCKKMYKKHGVLD